MFGGCSNLQTTTKTPRKAFCIMDEKKRKLLLRIGCAVIAGVFVFSIVGSLILQVASMMY